MKRKLTAILATDVAGYSRLMEADEAGTLTPLPPHRSAADEDGLSAPGPLSGVKL